jgi:hypothetical protein
MELVLALVVEVVGIAERWPRPRAAPALYDV